METNRVIVLKKITVLKPGQIVHFQIKLPPDTIRITGVKISTMRKLKLEP